ncbi:MAG: hypothetical protein NBV65_04380 [Burkholderiaceae bacterium]|nr:hypothetical protein [Burkholderiaceae bacterium]
MSQEKTQIFRGDDAPEMGIADTGEAAAEQRRQAPVDQRALSDSKDAPQGERRELRDADGESIARRMDDAAGGPDEQRRMDDAEGLSERREMHDADGLSQQRTMNDADGLSELRQLHDHKAALPGDGVDKPAVALNFNDDEPEPAPVPAAVPAKPAIEPPSAQDDADLTFKVERDATPWALSIHLEERIASLGLTTAKVNEQLDALEASTKRLAKRVGK